MPGRRAIPNGAAVPKPLVPGTVRLYIGTMSGFFLILLALAMLAVLASLLAGVFLMARGGESNERHSNRLMRLRVTLQGVALVLFLLAILTAD